MAGPREKVQTPCSTVALLHCNWASAHIISAHFVMTHALGSPNLEVKLSAKAAKKQGTEARDIDAQPGTAGLGAEDCFQAGVKTPKGWKGCFDLENTAELSGGNAELLGGNAKL